MELTFQSMMLWSLEIFGMGDVWKEIYLHPLVLSKYLLDLEREAFLSLDCEKKTLERIQ